MVKIIKFTLLILVLTSCFVFISACQEDANGGLPPDEPLPEPPKELKPVLPQTDGSSSHNSVYTSSPDQNSQIKITKLLSPNLGTTYLVGDELVVIVEILNLNSKDVYGLSICERIDNNLEIINGSITNCYITRFANKSSIIINNLRNGKEIKNIRNLTPILNQNHGFIELYIDRLPLKGRAIYCYKMKPINAGIFAVTTIISFKDKEYPDYEYSLEDKCEKLDTMKIVVTPEKTKIYTGILGFLGGGSTTKINYQIKYLHQLSQNSGKKLNGKFLEVGDYYTIDYVSSNGSAFEDPTPNDDEKPFEIDYGHNCVVSIEITYKKENSAKAPIMYLDEEPYDADSQIIVIESFFWSHIEFFVAMISLLVAILIEILLLWKEREVAREFSIMNVTLDKIYEKIRRIKL